MTETENCHNDLINVSFKFVQRTAGYFSCLAESKVELLTCAMCFENSFLDTPGNR